MRTIKITVFRRVIYFVLIILIFSSCASIISGRKQKVTIDTYPSGARVYVEGKDQGVITPSTIKLRRKKEINLTFQKEGYNDGNMIQSGSFNGVTIGNILLGGIPGFLIDWGTGAIYKYPKNITYTLQPSSNQTLLPYTNQVSTYDPTVTNNEYRKMVTRDNSGETDLESTIIRWYFDSAPQGARLYWRVISNIPNIVKNTNELYLAPTPYEETRSFNILGLTYENSNNVTIEIKVKKAGYLDQVKRFNVRQAIDQQEISSFFDLVKAE